jgi:hypothetical protein
VVEPENAGEGLEAKLKAGDDDKKACPRALFRDTFVYLRREPLEPLPSFKMFLWDRGACPGLRVCGRAVVRVPWRVKVSHLFSRCVRQSSNR